MGRRYKSRETLGLDRAIRSGVEVPLEEMSPENREIYRQNLAAGLHKTGAPKVIGFPVDPRDPIRAFVTTRFSL